MRISRLSRYLTLSLFAMLPLGAGSAFAQPGSRVTQPDATMQADKNAIADELSSPALRKAPSPQAKLTPEARKFVNDVLPLVRILQNKNASDAEYAAAIQKLQTYIAANSRILNDPKSWPKPELAKRVSVEFASPEATARGNWRKICWRCLLEFLISCLPD